MVDTAATQDPQVEHIGAAPHPTRNLVMMIGAFLLIGVIGLFYFMTGRSDQASAVELDQFRQLLVTQCKLESFSGPTDPKLSQLYANSSRMRATVGEQMGALQRGGANCDQVLRSLRSVDFPVP